MALLQDLIRQIDDQTLRQRIMAEVTKLSKQKKFGLVFEEHLPECTPLYDVEIRKESKVALKAGQVSDIYIVRSIDGDKAICEHKTDHAKAEFALNDLVAVAEFGEPIYPYLKPIDTVCNAPGSDLWHTLIEADNYHALQLLEYLYAGKVDCIYIDPPYNTGARDWKYNNDYVDGSDAYRHSKWLSFMEKRLKLAKKLLNPKDSVLIVTIDEKEYLHLGCLLEEMFPNSTITMATDVINPRAGVARPNSFTRSQEYVFFIQLGNSKVVSGVIEDSSKKNPIWFSLMRTGSNSARSDRPNLFYPVWVTTEGHLFSVGENIPFNCNVKSVLPPQEGLIGIWPLRPDGRENTWQLGRETLQKAFDEGTAKINKHADKLTINYLRNAEKERIKRGEIIVEGREESGALKLRHNNEIGRTKAPDSVWQKASHDAGIYGSSLISAIFLERRFSFPKSLYATIDSLRYVVSNKPNALIVDFFAGSGTTLHAVNLLNAEDGGRRRCIMVTNNEVSDAEAKALTKQGRRPGDEEWEKLGIARYVTWPRTVCSIEGHDVKGNPLKGNYLGSDIPMADGFKANAAYFKLGFLDKAAVRIGRQFREMLPVLWMKAGCFGPCPQLKGQKVPAYMVLPENRMAILNDNSLFARFAEEVRNAPEIATVYLVTDSDADYRSMARGLDGKQTYQLYRDYLDNFRINSAR
ncbi:MAG: site-specific DNA-methyltransferase [Acidaminococcaceae bacterium]|nr:site-specific DNA-methyltransferase [Acidaminococcaceae bacterium]